MYNNGLWMIKYKQDVSNDMQGLKDELDEEIRRLQGTSPSTIYASRELV